MDRRARVILIRMAKQLVDDAPERAFPGLYRVGQLYCSPLAYKWFLYGAGGVMNVLPLPEDRKKDSQNQKEVRKEDCEIEAPK